MYKLKMIKDQLVECIEGQMSNLACVNTKELGEVVDMVKDLEEAMYYCHKIKMTGAEPKCMCEHQKAKNEAKSSVCRKGYLESKELCCDAITQKQNLEKYIQELSNEVVEIAGIATADEKSILQQRIATLSTKIV